MKTNQNSSDVVRAFQTIDQSCRCIQHRLLYQVGRGADQHAVAVVKSGKHQSASEVWSSVQIGGSDAVVAALQSVAIPFVHAQVCINVDAQITNGFYRSDRSASKE